MSDRKLKLALSLYGVGGPSQHNLWKDPRVPKNASIDIQWYIQQAQKAEAAKFDAIFIVDSLFINSRYPAHYLNRLEPLTLLSALAVVTENIGLVGTLTTSYNSPFNLARRFASLDQISGGRAGWNVVTSFDLGVAGNFGLDEHYDYDTRYGRAHEFVEVAQGLWDSYEDDAFPADVERDVFLDPSKLHELNHKGEYFSITGPLNLSRSPQGQPVIFQSGTSEQGRNLAGHVAEGIYTHVASIDEGVEFRNDIRRRAAALGRNPDHIVIFPGARPVIADTDEEAAAPGPGDLRVRQRLREEAGGVRPAVRRPRLLGARPRRAVPGPRRSRGQQPRRLGAPDQEGGPRGEADPAADRRALQPVQAEPVRRLAADRGGHHRAVVHARARTTG